MIGGGEVGSGATIGLVVESVKSVGLGVVGGTEEGFSRPNTLSNSSLVKPFKTTIVPSSFSILEIGVPAKLLETASISVKNSRLVSKFFSS